VLKLRFAGPSERPASPFDQAESAVHVWHNRRGGVVARGFSEAGYHWMAWPYLATFRFRADDPCITAYVLAGAPVDVVWDVYRRTVLPMALQVFGWEALHASAVVCEMEGRPEGRPLRTDGRGVVAFSAVSETGKSTVAYGLRRRGFPQWSDDGVVFRMEDHPLATPLPFAARLRPESQKIFSADADASSPFEENGAGEQQFAEPLPIAAICLLRRTADAKGSVATIRSVASSAAFPALLIHAHEFDPNNAERRARMMQTYLDLVAHVPVFEVAFVPDRKQIDRLLDAIVGAMHLRPPAVAQRDCA
jgi:hypothetical protein